MASGFVALGSIDLDDIFATRVTTKTHNVQYYIEGVDISNRYEKLTTPPLAQVTGYEWHGADLNTIFQAKGGPPSQVSYRFLNTGTDLLAQQTFPAVQWPGDYSTSTLTTEPTGGIPPPVLFLSFGAGFDLFYPGGIFLRGIDVSNAFAFGWIDQVTVPEGTFSLIDDLWAQFDTNAVPVVGEQVMSATGTNSINAANPGQPINNQVAVDVTVTTAMPNPQEFLDTYLAADTAGISGVDATGTFIFNGQTASIEDYWAQCTAAAKACGLYDGINQVGVFPLFLVMSGTFSYGGEDPAPPVACGETPGTLFSTGVGPSFFGAGCVIGCGNVNGPQVGSVFTVCDGFGLSSPTVLIERIFD